MFPHWGGEHQNCLGKVARRAVIFSDQMCETILRGISLQLKSDRRLRSLEHGICHVDATVLDGDDYVAMSSLRSKPLKSGSRPLKADETTSYNKPEVNVNIHSSSAHCGLFPVGNRPAS